MKKIMIINGPNLNLLGSREPSIYGCQDFPSFVEELRRLFPNYLIEYFQSNIEGELIDCLHKNAASCAGFLLNAGGYTHTSVAILDGIKAISAPVIEIHISNVAAREEFRHTSLIGAGCIGSISGFGLDSYRLGILALEKLPVFNG